jgi:gluconate 2-dehydrogenase gamma chain
MAEDQPRIISRRDILRGAGIVGAAAAAGPASLLAIPETAGAAASAVQPRVPAREAFENLTAREAQMLEVIVDRLIPSDASGPGAKEARAAHYIDRALGGGLASSREAYTAGFAALDRHASATHQRPFLQLSPVEQHSVLIECEADRATGFTGSSAQFFAMVLNHTRQGMFGDPYYGGNANFVGWDLIGYPGVRTMVSPADQKRLEANELKSNHRSAYDYDAFNKATVRAGSHGDTHHGD